VVGPAGYGRATGGQLGRKREVRSVDIKYSIMELAFCEDADRQYTGARTGRIDDGGDSNVLKINMMTIND